MFDVMIEPIIIKQTKNIPKIIFDKKENVFEIRGRSILENVSKFYSPIEKWVSNYVNDPNDKTELDLYLEYINSASAKKIVGIILIFQKITNKPGKTVVVNWHYENDDEIMKERGEDIQSAINIELKLIPVDEIRTNP